MVGSRHSRLEEFQIVYVSLVDIEEDPDEPKRYAVEAHMMGEGKARGKKLFESGTV